jgi:3-isopropylmalate/(R)-2-methylmalate dehydratase small subunit
MENLIRGRVYRFGDNINSDIIIPGRYLIYIEPEKLAEHAFEVLGADVPRKLRSYDVFVAGRNFGCGSAREQAATAIIGLGVKAVIACSFARTFYRNAINSGLPIIECPSLYEAVREDDQIEIDMTNGSIQCNGKQHTFPKFPDSVRELLELGGLAEYLKKSVSK